MTIETATYINDLAATNPPSTDPVSQGDDHIRLVKAVLQNQFTGATRAFQIPGALTKSANYSVAKVDGESTVYVSTAVGAVTLTLPSLVALDAGWKIHFIKTTSDNNPMFIKPTAGNLNSGGMAALAQARRGIPGVRITAIWDGANWFVTRALALPIGSSIAFHASAIPAGFEWPSGQTLSSAANYPEYNAMMGSLVTPDLRGRIPLTLDNLGGTAAGRLGSIITGTAVGNVGGAETVTLTVATVPALTYSGTTSGENVDHTHGYVAQNGVTGPLGIQGGATFSGYVATAGPSTVQTSGRSQAHSHTFSGTTTGSGGAHSNLQPSIMCSRILVVE